MFRLIPVIGVSTLTGCFGQTCASTICAVHQMAPGGTETVVAWLQILDSGDLWESVSARLAAAEPSLPKPPANPASRTARTPLPAVLSALQPLVECYFALCAVCGLLGPPPQRPSFETVTPLDAEGQAAIPSAPPQPESPRATQDAAAPFSQCVSTTSDYRC